MKRPNLTVKTGAQALGIGVDGGRAAGVRWRDRRGRGATSPARAARSSSRAGRDRQPAAADALAASGPARHLRELGIEPRVDSPGVGENLQDHPFFLLCFESTATRSLADAEKPPALLQYLLRRSGPLTSNVGEAIGFIRTRPGLAGRRPRSSSSAPPTTTTTASTPTTATRSRWPRR